MGKYELFAESGARQGQHELCTAIYKHLMTSQYMDRYGDVVVKVEPLMELLSKYPNARLSADAS